MKKAYVWLLAVAAAALVIALSVAICGAEYADAHEALIMKTFSGYQGGSPASFNPRVYTALGWLLYALQSLMPGVPWLSALLIALICLSAAIICRGLTACARANGLPAWAGALLGALCLAALGLQACCRVSLASVAALCGAASVAQMFSIDFSACDDKRVLRALPLSAAALLISLCLDEAIGLGSLAILCFAALSVRLGDYSHRDVARLGTRARIGARGLAVGVFVCVFCVASFVAVRAAELGAMSEYTAWRGAYNRLEAMGAFSADIPDATLEAAGWTREGYEAAASGFVYGGDISAESMTGLADALAADGRSTGASLAEFTTRALKLWSLPTARLLICGLLALALAGVLAPRGSRARPGARLSPLWILLGGGALCAWLMLTGRSGDASTALAPCLAGLLCVAVRAATSQSNADEGVADAASDISAEDADVSSGSASGDCSGDDSGICSDSAGDAASSVTPVSFDTVSSGITDKAPASMTESRQPLQAVNAQVASTIQSAASPSSALVSPTPELHSANRGLVPTLRFIAMALMLAWAALAVIGAALSLKAEEARGDAGFEQALYDYALAHPTKLIFYSPKLVADTRLFPDMSGVPRNVLLPDPSLARSDATLAQLKRFGIDGWRFKRADMLGSDVLVAGTEKGPWQRLLPYLREGAAGDRYWASYDSEGELFLYRLCER